MNKRSRDNLLLKQKVFIFLCASLIFIFVIILQLLYLQIYENKRFSELGERNFLRTEVLFPRRGNVYDCHGNMLATNRPIFDLYWHGGGRYRFLDSQKSCLDKLKTVLGNDLFDSKMLNRISRAERFSRRILIKKTLSKDNLCKISEQCSGSPNLFIDRRFERLYPHKALAAHILGYLRRVERNGDFRGLYGLERMFESDLQGESGYVRHVINATGKRMFKTESCPASAGKDLCLTIDLPMQRIAEKLFSPGQAGAFIVMDPDDGAIKVMLSYPNFDPNMFLNSISEQDWNDRFSTDSPLLNRAIHALYPPASIFKLITFVSGLEEGVITIDTEFNCKGYTMFGGRKYNCQRRWGHGLQLAQKALCVSCNIPCYEIAQKITVDQIAAYAMRFGLGQPTEFLFSDKKGIVPTSSWKQACKGMPWWRGETLSVSIGQSFLLVTPLQIVRMIGSICTGNLVRPRILADSEIERYPLYITDKTLEFLREVMREVVIRGTARGLNTFKDFAISAKTGTAQIVSLGRQKKGDKKQLEHAWFASFFSYKGGSPLVMVVLVEHAGSSRPAVHIAKNFLRDLKSEYEKKKGGVF